MDDLLNEMAEKNLVTIKPLTPQLAIWMMINAGTKEYRIEPRLLIRYSMIYDKSAGKGTLNFPKWLYPSVNLKENQ